MKQHESRILGQGLNKDEDEATLIQVKMQRNGLATILRFLDTSKSILYFCYPLPCHKSKSASKAASAIHHFRAGSHLC